MLTSILQVLLIFHECILICYCHCHIYCHMLSVLQKGFWLVIRFIGLLNSLWLHTLQITITQIVFSVMVFTALLGSGFQWWDFPLPLGSRTLPGLSYRLPNLLSASWLTANSNWSLPYSLGTDHTENTASNSSSIVVWSVVAITWRLLNQCLTTGTFAQQFPSNGCLCWLSADMPQSKSISAFSSRPTSPLASV
jgi:hypothetical protein